jgi:hydroxyquinol 1,2-dioxygenase
VSSRRTAPADITAAVIASFESAENERLRTLVQSLARHLHAFATEVGLTQREWEEGIRILTETGDITDDRRQEFILWSDTLGLSMLVDVLANPFPPGATESTVLGPFYSPDLRSGLTGRRSPRRQREHPHGSTAACST